MTETSRLSRASLLPWIAAWATCVPAAAAWAGVVPSNIPSAVEPEATVRVFVREEPWTLLAELQGSNQTDERQYRSAMLGGYYRVVSNLRAGLFYERQYGFRHDEDWVKDPVTEEWGWLNANGRGEDLLLADVSPKFQLDFLPGDAWTLELKTRYQYDFFDQQETLRFRPNLSYFWLSRGRPVMSFFVQAELAFPLNYGNRPLNERWAYLGALYHFSPTFQAGMYGALKWQAWASTAPFTAETGNTYEATAESTVIGLLAVFQLRSGR